MENQKFKPYIPAEKVTPELTVTSIVIGVLLAIIFGAANAYLGLRVGTTISASIPAAVISMAVIRVILKKNSILESNMVQTIGSAGESLAAGSIFTMPALFLWAREGLMESPSLITLTIIAICGGFLGVFFMVPLRNALIVKEHGVLPYPEGTACADVLLAGEEGGTSAKAVFLGMGFAAIIKFLTDGIKAIGGVLVIPVKALKTQFALQVYPALVGVGYICGIRIAGFMLAGGLISWFVLIPLIVSFGGDAVIAPAAESIGELYASGGAEAIWSNYIRYIGAGAVAAGGIISLIKTTPLIISTFAGAIKGLKGGTSAGILRTEQDMNIKIIGIGILAVVLALWLIPTVPISLGGAVFILIFGFFFATVSSRMVGLVGSTNNPISGMAIATLLFATAALKLSGTTGAAGMEAAIAIGSVICIVAAMAGDTSQDLKTGYILGATPVKQQKGELIGAAATAFAIGGIMILLDKAWGFGSPEIAAPQATLMKMIVEGVMEGNLPWGMVFTGVFLAIAVECVGVSALPVAIGIYLPLELSTTIAVGGLVRYIVDRQKQKRGEDEGNADASNGVLFCSGMIAGEGLIGILLAIFAITGIDSKICLPHTIGGPVVQIIFILIMAMAVWFAERSKSSK